MKRELSIEALIAATGEPPPAEEHGPCRGCQQFVETFTARSAWTEADVMDARVLAALICWGELDVGGKPRHKPCDT